MAIPRAVSEIQRCISWKSPNLPTPVGFIASLETANDTGVILVPGYDVAHEVWVPYLYAQFHSYTLAGCTVVDAEAQDEEDDEEDDGDEEMTRTILIY